jgi:phosphatidate cytidylyltransferase
VGDLGKRLATAGVLVPLVLAAIYADATPWGILALVGVVGALALDEYLRMALPVTPDDPAWSLRVLGTAATVGCVAGAWRFGLERATAATVMGAGLMAALIVLARRSQLEHAGRHLAAAWSGLVYVPVLITPLALLKLEGRPHALVVTACAAFFSDTVAYFCGRAFGRHKLYPEVSPKKTWEGALGGLAGGVLATAGVGSSWLVPELALGTAVLVGIAASAAGQVGDLVESMLKRAFGVKDSGTVLPGHGGMLDRIDALLFVGPLMYYLLPR